jgi:starch synthase
MALLQANPAESGQLLPLLQQEGFSGRLEGLGLLDPFAVKPWGGLFLPDPSIGRWAQWRQPVGPAAFSLIGQIHTLSTPSALAHLQDLVTEPVQPWDALICSSTAGRAVVQGILEDRERQLLERCGGGGRQLASHRPQLPVIPLPLPVRQMLGSLPVRQQAREALGVPADAHVVLWLGRLSALTKADPYPMYAVLQRVALQLERPLLLIECGPDDTAGQAEECRRLRALCPAVRFVRLGDAQPVEEPVKLQALAAADLACSLVDNAQETFGLAVAEAMAAGLPVVASDWDGYRDLVRDGIDGFLVPSRWAASAEQLSVTLGWQQFTGLQPFPAIAGALAQLVQLDLGQAEAAVLGLLRDPALTAAMGRAAQGHALACFDSDPVMAQYEQLFAQLAERRAAAPGEAHQPHPSPLHLDPVRAFAGFASHPPLALAEAAPTELAALPEPLPQARGPLWQLLLQSASEPGRGQLRADLLRKHR